MVKPKESSGDAVMMETKIKKDVFANIVRKKKNIYASTLLILSIFTVLSPSNTKPKCGFLQLFLLSAVQL